MEEMSFFSPIKKCSYTIEVKQLPEKCFGHLSGGYDEQTGVSKNFMAEMVEAMEKTMTYPSASNENCHFCRHLWRLTNLHFKLPKMQQVLCLGDLLERGNVGEMQLQQQKIQ